MENITFDQLPTAFTHLFNKVENIEKLLLQKSETKNEDDELLTIQQASSFLKLSVPTIYGLVSRSIIPVNKKGKRLYFSKHELTEWVKSGRKSTIAEIRLEVETFSKNKKHK